MKVYDCTVHDVDVTDDKCCAKAVHIGDIWYREGAGEVAEEV